MLWRIEVVHHLELLTMQDQARMIDASRFAIVAAGDFVWTAGPRPERAEHDGPVHV